MKDWKVGAALVVGGLVLGGVVSSFAADRASPGARHARPHHALPGPMVRAEALVEGAEDGTFKTIEDDAGTLTAIDGNTLTIEEADGRIVRVVVDGDTTYGRDGKRAKLSDLKVGDHVFAHREKDGDSASKTERVMAMSPEQYKRMQERRAACEKDAGRCPHPHGGPDRARWGNGPGGGVEPAPGPAYMERSPTN